MAIFRVKGPEESDLTLFLLWKSKRAKAVGTLDAGVVALDIFSFDLSEEEKIHVLTIMDRFNYYP